MAIYPLFKVNHAAKTIHAPEPKEACNLDDATELGEEGFSAAAHLWGNEGYQPCGHCLEAPESDEEDE